ncbi:hypothetical protein B0T24DRAFT_572047 [Lasiosphaeria ovina]|uniref:DUF7580 domain-containing protein n=1 Tax=Lasiosphaeria ovina TaxID=92902 RepID=A0AAE0KGA9_9PEZI|nr:hypothetical protein B0T24DRAFT_572047 [Lasiosphaeria ovina]
MEIVGVVLGGIPLALYALDSYKRCLRMTKDVVKYGATLETFRLHIFIQRKQLELTLRNVGLRFEEGQLPTRRELDTHLARLYPSGHAEFLSILSQMEGIMAKLLDKLDVDSQGKPKWTTDPPERAAWNWRRVKRGLGGSDRDELVQHLQYLNTALSKVFEKVEILQDEDGPLVQRLQARFDTTACDAIRSKARCIHNAFAKTWQCECPEHRANLAASWHLDVENAPSPLALSIQTRHGTWLSLTVDFEATEEDLGVPNTTQTATLTSSVPSDASGTPPPKKVSFRAFRNALKPVIPAQTELLPLAPSPAVVIATTDEVQCLCEFISTQGHAKPGFVLCADQDDPQSIRRLILRHAQAEQQQTFLALNDMLSSTRQMPVHQSQFANQAPANLTLGLSRKERFAIAAAASWAVLYLCGTPWLREEEWSRSGAGAIQLGVDDPYSIRPAVSCDLKAGKARGKQPDTSSWTDADRPSKIRNKFLFALGVLLMELSLNKTIDSIQQESRAGSVAGRRSNPCTVTSPAVQPEPDIYELAERQTDRVYIDAGHSYGYAVQRCLRCEFPGRDSMKSFDFAQFRRQFFDTVVAPVHAAYIVQRL